MLFAAKNAAFWCKTHFNLMQNAVQFGAKRTSIWCKTQCNLLLNAVQFAAKCRTK